MPRRRSPARLYQRPDDGAWIIRDGGRDRRTGYGPGEREEAEEALAAYLAGRALRGRAGPAQPGDVIVGEILARYVEDKGKAQSNPVTLATCVKALAHFWGDLTADAVRGETCRRYARERRVKPSTARRELGVLQAALNHAHAEGLLLNPPKVTLPPAGRRREREMSREEEARIMAQAPEHLRRFVRLATVTGRRERAILALGWTPALDRGWVDLDRRVIEFLGARDRETAKRRGSVRLEEPFLSELASWRRPGDAHVILWRGRPVADLKTAWRATCRRAGVSGLTIHDLKATAVSRFFAAGGSMEDAVDYFATTSATLEGVYRRYSPEHQKRAAIIMQGARDP